MIFENWEEVVESVRQSIQEYLYHKGDLNDIISTYAPLLRTVDDEYLPGDVHRQIYNLLKTDIYFIYVVRKSLSLALWDSLNYNDASFFKKKERINDLEKLIDYREEDHNSTWHLARECLYKRDYDSVFRVIYIDLEDWCVPEEVNKYLSQWTEEDVFDAMVALGMVEEDSNVTPQVELSDEEYDEGFDESVKKHKRRIKY